MVSYLHHTKEMFINMLEKQQCCDITFKLKDQVEIKGHSYILSDYSKKFICTKENSQLIFEMDQRVEVSDFWFFIRYLYDKPLNSVKIANIDSYTLLAYFFEDQDLIDTVDDYLLETISVLTAVQVYHYALKMKLSQRCNERIYAYIQGNVIKLPAFSRLDESMLKIILSYAYFNQKFYMENISQGPHDLPPIIVINSKNINQFNIQID